MKSTSDTKVRYQIRSTADTKRQIPNEVNVRYQIVAVHVAQKMTLSLCVYVLLAYNVALISAACEGIPNEKNVARGRSVCQSTMIAGGNPRRAIDGNKSGTYGDGSCTHTDKDNPAWWRVDLNDDYKISRVIVTNRRDCCYERLGGAEVRVGNSTHLNKNSLCGIIWDVLAPTVTICCDRMEGRYVSIAIVTRREYLTLCEVEVYGVPVHDKTPCQ
ncbi:fucolectin-4-like [Discoglossus pictus]